jgi:hypothetical protein
MGNHSPDKRVMIRLLRVRDNHRNDEHVLRALCGSINASPDLLSDSRGGWGE